MILSNVILIQCSYFANIIMLFFDSLNIYLCKIVNLPVLKMATFTLATFTWTLLASIGMN